LNKKADKELSATVYSLDGEFMAWRVIIEVGKNLDLNLKNVKS
jgi:hypothetical protein